MPTNRPLVVLVLLLGLLAMWVPGVASANPQLLIDMRTGEVLHAEEAGHPWHPASLTKLMTALVTFEAITAGRVKLDTLVIMSANAAKAPPSKVGLPVDTAITLQDALYILIVQSANDMASAIAETVSGSVPKFVSEMNVMANALGMTATHYVNANGLHDPRQVTSARDLAVLALTIRARYPQFARIFATETVTLGKASLKSHNNLLTDFAGTTGMKTGFVCSAGLNIVATVERGGQALMAVVLGASSGRERGEMTGALVLSGLRGQLRGTGQSVIDLPNQPGIAPVDMRSLLCGKESKDYVAAREAAFPYGLEGQESFLTDEVAPISYEAHTLGRLREVPLPQSRPANAPVARAVAAPVKAPVQAANDNQRGPVPVPRPRPASRG